LLTEEIREGHPLAAGRYRVLRRLGAGGMATVFLAEDERLGRQVAIKRLHTDAPNASLRRFKQEARIGAALNHPGLVAVYDTVAAEEGALIVMEYVEGKTLGELAGGRPMKPSKAMPILRSVAEALDHAHSQGVVHRDVKPGNVIVGDDGIVKLADLGIARAVGASQITSEGSVVGTLPYMSPERLAGPGAGGPPSDVYALAAVAFELLSGRPPSEASSTGEAAAQQPPDLRREWPGGPAAAIAVLERGLDDDPDRRQPSAGTLISELDAALERGEEETAPTAPFDALPPTRVARGGGAGSPLSRPVAIAVLALCVLAIAGVAFSSGGDGGGSGDTDAAKPKKEKAEPAAEAEQAPEPEPEPAPSPEPTSGAELNDLGFSLIGEGRYDEAIPVLERAVDALRDSGDDLTYSYALFNLGNALRLAGRPEEAIPYLQERLEYPNQTGEVRRELEAAYADAGIGDESGGEEGGPPHGNAKGHDKHGPGGDDD
jgi:serine/threonine-protein kinase